MTVGIAPNLVRGTGNHVGALRDALTDGRVPNVAGLSAGVAGFADTLTAISVPKVIGGAISGCWAEALTVNVVPLQRCDTVAVGTLRDALTRVLVSDVARRAGYARYLCDTEALAANVVPKLVRRAGNHIFALGNALTDGRVPNVAEFGTSVRVSAKTLTTGKIPSVIGRTVSS